MSSPGLEHLNVASSARDIEDYFERFEIWWITQAKPNEEKKSAFFLNFAGKDAYALIKNLSFPSNPVSVSYDKIKDILLTHVKPANFESSERAKFHSLVRKPSQEIREFILQLLTQAAKCNFNDLDTQMRDRLIAGINDNTLQNELLKIHEPTFKDIRAHCEQYQDARTASSSLPCAETSVMFNSNKRRIVKGPNAHQFKSVSSYRDNNHEHSVAKSMGKCLSCGKNHLRQNCSFRNAKCYQCGKVGHIKTVCRSHCKLVITDDSNSESISNDFCSLTLTLSSSTDGHIYQSVKFSNGHSHDFIVDTGSVESIISKSVLHSIHPNSIVIPTNLTIRGVTGHILPVLGTCKLTIMNSDSEQIQSTFIVTARGPSILGLKVLRALNVSLSLLSHSPSHHQEIRNLILHCSKISGGMNIAPVHLNIDGDPIFMKRRLIPYGLTEPVQKVLKSLCDRGILVPVEASKWATPIVTPLKRDGQTPRVCGDYRITLNPRLLQRSCTTEEPEAILSRLHGSRVFSKIDLKDAYLQIPLDDESSHATTINTPFGLYRYNFLPFGLSASPAIFQQVINTIIADIEGVECYQDDIILHAPNKTIHDERLLQLLRRFHAKNVCINPKKCSFSVHSFNCLGYLVDGNGFRPDPKRLSALVDAPSPTSLTELRSVLGALQYYARFIPNFAYKASLLFDVLSSNSFEWNHKHETCLRSLLTYLSSHAVLRPYSPSITPVLVTDASPVGLGAVLEQDGRPVICISRRLSKAEQGYAQTHREALAVYWAVKRLHKFLFGTHFEIVSDHEALKFIFNPTKSLAKSSAAMVQRWSIALGAYSYSISHRSAKSIEHADYLSRCPVTSEESNSSDCLLIQPLPVSRHELIIDTKRSFGTILIALKKGWNSVVKRKFPAFHARREELCVTPDGLLCLNDRVVIPPKHRPAVLDDLHSGHIGIEKMKSLARLTCWWPEINSDLNRYVKNCEKCQLKPRNTASTWTPWPVSTEAWQRVHADYCGPFINRMYALVVIDSFSKWPEVFFTKSPTAEFSILALRRVFSREGIPVALVTDNGSHFSAKKVTDWLSTIGCKHLFTAPRHPCSNGQAENFIRTLKNAIQCMNPSTFEELERAVDVFLLQYRNSVHSSTRETPAKLSKGRNLRSNLLSLNTSEVTYYRGNDLRPSTGIILKPLGQRMFQILDVHDQTIHRRHLDQIRFNDSGQLVPISDDLTAPNEFPLSSRETGNLERESEEEPIQLNQEPLRRSERLLEKPRIDYKRLDSNLKCGECDD